MDRRFANSFLSSPSRNSSFLGNPQDFLLLLPSRFFDRTMATVEGSQHVTGTVYRYSTTITMPPSTTYKCLLPFVQTYDIGTITLLPPNQYTISTAILYCSIVACSPHSPREILYRFYYGTMSAPYTSSTLPHCTTIEPYPSPTILHCPTRLHGHESLWSFTSSQIMARAQITSPMLLRPLPRINQELWRALSSF